MTLTFCHCSSTTSSPPADGRWTGDPVEPTEPQVAAVSPELDACIERLRTQNRDVNVFIPRMRGQIANVDAQIGVAIKQTRAQLERHDREEREAVSPPDLTEKRRQEILEVMAPKRMEIIAGYENEIFAMKELILPLETEIKAKLAEVDAGLAEARAMVGQASGSSHAALLGGELATLASSREKLADDMRIVDLMVTRLETQVF